MRCSESSEQMSLYLDGLLNHEQALSLQAHLAHCEVCRREWEAMCWLSSFLEGEPVVTPAPDFTAGVLLRLRQREARRRRLYSSLGVCIGSVSLWMLAGVALSLLLIVLWRPLIRVVVFDVGLSLVHEIMSIVAVLGKAVYSITYALSVQSAWLLVLGYAVLALGLTVLWVHIVFRRWRHVLQ